MRWLLARYCILALINLSVAHENTTVVIQRPRFYGLKINQEARFYCYTESHKIDKAKWYKENVNGGREKLIEELPRIVFNGTVLILKELKTSDSGVYFCKLNGTLGPGTALQVVRTVKIDKAERRSNMKDGLIILQALLLAVFIAAILLRKHSLDNQRDSIYEEPETDHIYEGLAIETCGGGLYEELSVYTQAEGGEAPWE